MTKKKNLTFSLRVSSETVEGKLLRGMSTNVVMPPEMEEFAGVMEQETIHLIMISC